MDMEHHQNACNWNENNTPQDISINMVASTSNSSSSFTPSIFNYQQPSYQSTQTSQRQEPLQETLSREVQWQYWSRLERKEPGRDGDKEEEDAGGWQDSGEPHKGFEKIDTSGRELQELVRHWHWWVWRGLTKSVKPL